MKDQQDASVLSARLAKAFPSLSAYSAATLAEELCAIERAQRRHAERCCSGEDGGYVRLRNPQFGMVSREHDPEAEKRAEKRIEKRCADWRQRLMDRLGPPPDIDPRHPEMWRWDDARITLQGDPRGPVLLLRLPNETEAKGV